MRILIVKLSSLGDLFHALPAVHMIRQAYPGCTLDWVTHAAYKPLVACFSDVDRTLAFPRNNFRKQGLSFIRELRQQPYDLVVDLQGLLKSAFVTRTARARQRIGPSFCREGSHLFYDATAGCHNPDRHAVDQILDVIDHLKIPRSAPRFPVQFPDYPKPANQPHIAIAPVSRWPSKNWPTDRFAEVARHLQSQWKATITLIGAPGEEQACNAIAAKLPPESCRNLAGKTSLPEMGGIIASADILIANDSGSVHMAAATGTPTVVIFGPTNPVKIGPYGTGHQILVPATPCSCGRQRICLHPETACIKQISIDNVIHAANQTLESSTHP